MSTPHVVHLMRRPAAAAARQQPIHPPTDRPTHAWHGMAWHGTSHTGAGAQDEGEDAEWEGHAELGADADADANMCVSRPRVGLSCRPAACPTKGWVRSDPPSGWMLCPQHWSMFHSTNSDDQGGGRDAKELRDPPQHEQVRSGRLLLPTPSFVDCPSPPQRRTSVGGTATLIDLYIPLPAETTVTRD